MSEDLKLEQKRTWIQGLDDELSEGRARRILEIESPELIGKGYPPALDPDRVPQAIAMTYFDLQKSMNRTWTEARMSYVYGFFQGCTFLVAAVLELLLEQYLRLQNIWPSYESKIKDAKKRTLGTVIGFCRENAVFAEQVICDASEINDLRIEAVHMTTEKRETGTPSDEHPLIEWEDATVVKSMGGQASISVMALPGQSVICDLSDPSNPRWKRELFYKPQASKAFKLLSEVFWSVRLQAEKSMRKPPQ